MTIRILVAAAAAAFVVTTTPQIAAAATLPCAQNYKPPHVASRVTVSSTGWVTVGSGSSKSSRRHKH